MKDSGHCFMCAKRNVPLRRVASWHLWKYKYCMPHYTLRTAVTEVNQWIDWPSGEIHSEMDSGGTTVPGILLRVILGCVMKSQRLVTIV